MRGNFVESDSVEVEKVECIEDHPVRSTRFQVGLQAHVKLEEPGLVLDDELAVEKSRAELPGCGGRRHRLEFRRPVEAFAGEELDAPAVDPRLQTIAVELDLVDPLVLMGASSARVARPGSMKVRRSPLRASACEPVRERASASCLRPARSA